MRTASAIPMGFFHFTVRFRFSRELPVKALNRLRKEDDNMNMMQKEKARLMRGSGMSCAKIASELGLSENTVKSFCKRNRLGGSTGQAENADSGVQQFCLNCGIPIGQTAGYRAKKYCSDRCRITWWNKHTAAPGRQSTRAIVCLFCGRKFDAYGKRDRKFCTRLCCARSKTGRT